MEVFVPSPVFVDAVINHPGVRQTVQLGIDRLHSYDVVVNPKNRVLAFEGGVALFLGLEPKLFEGHVFCLPSQRGATALTFGRQALDHLFTVWMATKLVVPAAMQLPAARFYCRRLGLRLVGRDLFHEYFEAEAA